PPESLLDQVRPSVALTAGKTLSHELGLARLGLERAGVAGQGRAVELPQHLESEAGHPHLVGFLTVLHVVPFTMTVVPGDQLGDGQSLGLRPGLLLSADSHSGPPVPLRQESVILLPALGGTVPSKVVIAAIDPDDGEVFGLVVAILGIALGGW